jgi:RHS repeat-associated protein
VSAVAPSYDAAGNVASLTTTLAPVNGGGGGTETQAFCYDDQDRLTWASTQSTGSCGRAGSEGIAGAGYSATYAYDANGHVTSGWVITAGGADLATTAQGSWTYQRAAPDQIASIGSGGQAYSAAYDPTGDQTCRAYGSLSCTNPTPTGESLTYDQLRRLLQWTNAAGTSSEQYAYDGEGERVWRQAAATVGGTTTTTTTSYVLGVQEWTSTAVTGQGTTTSTTSLYPLPGGGMATRDGSGLTYQGSDALGTPVAALNATSGVVGEQLFAPYGQPRYAAAAPTNGGLHTSFGFTGQHADSGYPGASGLDYFQARYLDPVVGAFTSADGVYPHLHDPAGLDPYAYVRGRVESARDPSGHAEDELDNEARGYAPADGLSVEVPGASPAGTAADVPSVGGDTLTIDEADGTTITYADDGTQVTIHNADGSETIEDNPFAAPTEEFENQATVHAAEAEARGTTPTTPSAGPSTGPAPATPGEGAASGDGSSGAEPPSIDSTSPTGSDSSGETVYTFGNAQGIRGARGGDFPGADTNALPGQNPADGEVSGMSATVNPTSSGLTGVYYSLPDGTTLPDGVGMIRDGADVGGQGPLGHVTFYPTTEMSLDEFNGLLRSLPWTRAGRI